MRDLTRYNRTHTQYALQFFRVFSYHPVYRFYIFQSGILEAHVRVEYFEVSEGQRADVIVHPGPHNISGVLKLGFQTEGFHFKCGKREHGDGFR